MYLFHRLLIIILFSFLLLSCNDEITTIELPPENFQQDIEWPSLADSPWPIIRGNPQGTCRSNFIGPQAGAVEWSIDSLFLFQSGIVLSKDAKLYAHISGHKHGLYSFSPEGDTIWKYSENYSWGGEQFVSPLVLSDGSIVFFEVMKGNLICISANGNVKWMYKSDKAVFNLGITVDKNGIIYFIDQFSYLHAVNQKGQLVFKQNIPEIYASVYQFLTMSPDGQTIYATGHEYAVIAFDLQKRELKWRFHQGNSAQPPMVDVAGNVYVTVKDEQHTDEQTLYSLDDQGKVRWNIKLSCNGQASTVAMDKWGNIITCSDTLYSVDYQGQLNWNIPAEHHAGTFPLIDAEGSIYISYQLPNFQQQLTKISKNGEVLWQTEVLKGLPGICNALGDSKIFLSFYRYPSGSIYKIR